MSDIFIHGEWGFGDGAGFESVCPATGESVWQGHEAIAAQVNDAIKSARAAQPKWAATPLAERIAILERYAENLTARKEAIAYAISRDMGNRFGKPAPKSALWQPKSGIPSARKPNAQAIRVRAL